MPQVEIKETIGCKKTLKIEVESERLDAEMETTLEKLKKEVQIPGFRKGKVPASIIKQRFKAVMQEEALRGMMASVLEEVFKEQGFNPVGEPQISNVDYLPGEPITFDVAFEEVPAIDLSGFEGLKVVKEVQEVSDENVGEVLEHEREMRAERIPVERGAEMNDILVINLQKLDRTLVPIIGEKMDGHVIRLDGISTPSPEFDEQVVGMKKGEKKNVSFTYDDSIENSDLAGTTDSYEVEIVEIVEVKLPELNDEFARSLGDYDSMDVLREEMRNRLVRMNEMRADMKLDADLINEFVSQNPFEVPNVMIEQVIQSEIDETARRMNGKPFDENAIRSERRSDAVRAVQRMLLVQKIVTEREVEASQEEVRERMEQIAGEIGKTVAEVRRELVKSGRFNSIKYEIVQKKAHAWMREVAEITEKTISGKPGTSNIITS